MLASPNPSHSSQNRTTETLDDCPERLFLLFLVICPRSPLRGSSGTARLREGHIASGGAFRLFSYVVFLWKGLTEFRGASLVSMAGEGGHVSLTTVRRRTGQKGHGTKSILHTKLLNARCVRKSGKDILLMKINDWLVIIGMIIRWCKSW